MDGSPRRFGCPSCGVSAQAANEAALARIRESGLCQGCRAGRTLSRRPEITALLVGFWRRAGFPESSSWLGAAFPRSVPLLTAPESGETAAGRLAH